MYVCMYVAMYVCMYVRMYLCTYVAMYSTNHPQLKQATRVTRVLSSCHTRVAFVA